MSTGEVGKRASSFPPLLSLTEHGVMCVNLQKRIWSKETGWHKCVTRFVRFTITASRIKLRPDPINSHMFTPWNSLYMRLCQLRFWGFVSVCQLHLIPDVIIKHQHEMSPLICRTQKQISKHSWVAVCLCSALHPQRTAIDFPVIINTKLLNVTWWSVGVPQAFLHDGVFSTCPCHHGNPRLFDKAHDKESSGEINLKTGPFLLEAQTHQRTALQRNFQCSTRLNDKAGPSIFGPPQDVSYQIIK